MAARGAEAVVSVVAIEATRAATAAAAAAAASVVVTGASHEAIVAAASAVVVAMASAVTTEAFPVATSTRLAAVVGAQAPLLQRHLLLALKTVRMMTRGVLDLDQTDRTDRTVYSVVGLLPLRHARAHPRTPVPGVSASYLARAKDRLLFQIVMATMGQIRSAMLGATSAMMMRQQLIRLVAAHLLPVLQRKVLLQ